MPVAPTQVTAANDHACFDTAGPQTTTVYSDAAYNSNTGVFGTADPVSIPLGNVLVSAPNYTNNTDLTTSGNWTISPKDSFRIRYIYNNITGIDTSASLPVFYQTEPEKFHLAALSEYHTFTSNLTNEARLGFNRFYQNVPSGNYSFPGLDAFPYVLPYDLDFALGPDGNAPQWTIQNLYELTDNISWVKGKHNLKFGFDGRKFIAPSNFTQRGRGDYEYDAVTEYLHDVAPTAFGERSTGLFSNYYGDQTEFFGYGNDVWHLTEKLTLNYGLRYEFTSVPVGERLQAENSAASVAGLISFGAPQPQYKNLLPRVGINYAPDQNTSIRAGFGMGVDVLYDNLGTLSKPPQVSTTFDVGNSPSPNPGDPNFLTNGGLPSTWTFKTIPAQQAATVAYVPNQKLPYAENWSLGVQHVFHQDYTAEVRYVGTRGIHLPTQIQLNIQPRVTAANQLKTYFTAPSDGELASLPNTYATIAANSNIISAFASNNFTSKITSYQPASESNYNGLAASLNRRFAHGLLIDSAFTWSKTMDDATATVNSTSLTPRRPQNSQDVSADYSRSALDRKFRYTLAATYDLPYFKTGSWVEKNLLGNWEVSPVYTFESPEYFTVLSGVNSNLNGDSTGIDRTIVNPSGAKGTGSAVSPLYDPSRASLCATGAQCNNNLVGYLALNPNAYYIEAGKGTLPTASRNSEPTQHTNNLDATASKKFSFTERYTLSFQAQAFNVFNHSQFIPGNLDNVNDTGTQVATYQTVSAQSGSVTNPGFNQPGNVFVANARTLQLSLKLDF
jgi:hypothetical protein